MTYQCFNFDWKTVTALKSFRFFPPSRNATGIHQAWNRKSNFFQDHTVWLFKWRPMTLRYKHVYKNLISFRIQSHLLPAVICKPVCLCLNACPLQPALGRNSPWGFYSKQNKETWMLEYINVFIIIFPLFFCDNSTGVTTFLFWLC